jgi:phosphoglycolate phosphatase
MNNNLKYEHIIWDWNGTLIHDIWLCVEVMNGLLKKYNIPLLTIERYREIFDFPVRDYYEKLGFDFQQNSFEEVGTEFIREYDRRSLECQLHFGAIETLTNFSLHGIRQSVLSARKQETLENEIKHFKLTTYFDHIVGLKDHYGGEKIKNGLLLLKESGLNPQKTIFIGDTYHDFEVARHLGTGCVLIQHGHHSPEKLTKAGVPVLDSLPEIISMIV